MLNFVAKKKKKKKKEREKAKERCPMMAPFCWTYVSKSPTDLTYQILTIGFLSNDQLENYLTNSSSLTKMMLEFAFIHINQSYMPWCM